MAHNKFVVDDSNWDEVTSINGYAVFMGYLMMGIRGLGILVVTWTTVVLLGGFVSDLGKKDFWCLTGITLVQSAGVFNFVLDETMSDLVRSGLGLLLISVATVFRPFYKVLDESVLVGIFLRLLALFLSGIQVIVLVIILCPVAVLYVLGIYMSAGAGLWRLIEHDFGNTDEAANLKSSLQVLYSLAVAQGVLYCYKTIHALGAKVGLAEFIAKKAKKDISSMDKNVVTAYIEETVRGCEKDPSFATERNLVTYAVNLMIDARSNDGFIASIKILGAAIEDDGEPGRKLLAKHLLTRPSSSFTQVTQRLLDALGSRSPYSGKIRAHAARIVALIASSIHLEEHRRWIHSISSVFETLEEYSRQREEYQGDINLPEEYERGWLLEEYEKVFLYSRKKPKVESTTSEEGDKSDTHEDYTALVLRGLNILQKLALDPENRIVIINTQGLLPKVLAPLNSKQLHMSHRYYWGAIAAESQKLLIQLAVALPGEAGSRQAILTTLECILECLDCAIIQKIYIVDIVLHLSLDTSSIEASRSSGQIFTWIVLLIFLFPDQGFSPYVCLNKIKISGDSSRLVGEKKLCSNQELPLCQSVGYVFGDLAKALVSAGGISTRVHAARILDFLVGEYTKDDEYLKELKNTIVSVMPEVLKEILGRGSIGEAETKAANNVQPSSSQEVDLEIGGVSVGGEGREQASSSQQQAGDEIGDIELRKELTKLCRKIKLRWYETDPDQVTRELDTIAENVCSEQGKPDKTFGELVEEERKKYDL